MEPASYRIAHSKPQQIIPINIPVANSPPLSKRSALPADPNTGKQPQYAKFESIDGNVNGEQLEFNDIVLGIKEGSLEVILIQFFHSLARYGIWNRILILACFISGKFDREENSLRTNMTRRRVRRVKMTMTRQE